MSTHAAAIGVSKRYRLGFASMMSRLFGRTPEKELWALDDVSLEVDSGDCLGVVGKNGAGKSTLLKVLCGVTTPTRGTVSIPKRVVPLIELTAGFHPELTGRDNVYLNGSLLGMTRKDLAQRLDAIVAFSGVEAFLDVPVKKYSSGMLVRLAFSTAIHVEPEMMVVDEALGVGDLSFTLKAHRAITDLQKKGVPIVLVSHNLQLIRNACNKAIWLDAGKVAARGAPNEVIAAYSRAMYSIGADETDTEAYRIQSDKTISVTGVEFLDDAGTRPDVFETGQPMTIKIGYETTRATEPLAFHVTVYHQETGTLLVDQNTRDDGADHKGEAGPTKGAVVMRMARQPFLAGRYVVTIVVAEADPRNVADWHEKLYTFAVAGGTVGYGAFCAFPEWSFTGATAPPAPKPPSDP